MNLTRAMIEAVMFGACSEIRWGICPWPLTKELIIDQTRTYPIDFTDHDADKVFGELVKTGFIFKVQPFDKSETEEKYYPSYDSRTLVALDIENEKLGKYMAECRTELTGALLSGWRKYGADIRDFAGYNTEQEVH